MDFFLLDAFKWTDLLQPQWYIETFGVWIIIFLVFAETGLLFGFFFPGDSLLFVAGVSWQLLEKGFFGIPFFIIMILIAICAIAGNMVGYWFGRKVGPAMYKWKDRWYFKQRHLQSAKEFYEKYGVKAVFMARFVPFVRTFAPIVAGIVQMDRKKFYSVSVISGFFWVFSMMLLGRYLHQFLLNKYNYDLTHDLEWIVLGIVLVTTLPVIIKLWMMNRKKKKERKLAEKSEA
jgi:membrane-associated protein